MGWFFHSANKVLGSVVNIRVDKWVDFDYLKGTLDFTVRQIKNIFSQHKQPFTAEDFEEARERLNLSEEDLIQQWKQYKNLTLFFSSLTIFIFIYFLYLVFRSNFMGACMTFALSLYGLSQVFRYHFWMYQIKRKKLGCTLKEWWTGFRKNKDTVGD